MLRAMRVPTPELDYKEKNRPNWVGVGRFPADIGKILPLTQAKQAVRLFGQFSENQYLRRNA